MEFQENPRNQGIQVISRAADILRLLSRETGGLSLGKIASQVDLPRSTVQRIVSALVEEGFVSNERGSGSIRLGPEIQTLALASAQDIKTRLKPVMKRLSEQTGETVDLAILEGTRMRFIDQIEGSQRLRTVSSIGETFPLATTANGKAALACLENSMVVQIVADEIGSGRKAKKNLENLLSELDAIRKGALATDENEHTDGICALGIALKDGHGDVFAVSIPVPSTRFLRVRKQLAKAINEHIGEIVHQV